MPENKQGVFCISLDFELQWGVFEKMKVGNNQANSYFINTRIAIPEMLDLFSQYDIQVTWAIVGMIYNQNLEMWKMNRPDLLPGYINKSISSYHWCDVRGQYLDESNLFAPELIDHINATPGAEIGTHSYSHYYCHEKGQTIPQFRADLEKAKELALSKGIAFESLVFPRNQFNGEYMEVCHQMGIKSVRTNPDKWYWDTSKKDTWAVKIMRTADVWFPINKKSVVPLDSIDITETPLKIPASRLYRAWTNNRILNALKMKRIFSEMTKAAKTGGLYHLWWHPHNFGNHPLECLRELKAILQHYTFLNKEYGLLSMNMKGLRNHLIEIQHEG
jgi:peptidoglycan/xylan/chitin deacetylase (PgdA/CDA1 family)